MSGDAFRFYHWAEAISEMPAVTPSTKLVAFALAKHANSKTGQCNPLQTTLAADVAITVRRVRAAIGQLKQIGALDVTHGRGKRAIYVPRQIGPERPVWPHSDRSIATGQIGPERPVQIGPERPIPCEHTKLNYESKFEEDASAIPSAAAVEQTGPSSFDENKKERIASAVEWFDHELSRHLGFDKASNNRERAAIGRLLDKFPQGQAGEPMKAALEFAFTEAFWASKVITAHGFEQNFDQLAAGAKAKDRAHFERFGTSTKTPKWTRTDYENGEMRVDENGVRC